MKATVVCSMRNEGPYIVEWVAWQRMLGFTDIVVVTNDCTDHSCELLDALEHAGVVTHLRCGVKYGGNRVAPRKLRMAHAHPAVLNADWVFVCDVDEFLVIKKGDGLLFDLLGDSPDFLVMAINWRVFGTSGVEQWQDGLVHRRFFRAALKGNRTSVWVKSLFRHAALFENLGEHGPRQFDLQKIGKEWGKEGMRFVNSKNEDISEWTPEGDYVRRLPREFVSYDIAQINHYMMKSEENWRLKRDTNSARCEVDRYDNEYYDKFNRNECADHSAMRYKDRFEKVYQDIMALPQVDFLHHQCCIDYLTRAADRQGYNVHEDQRYEWHLTMIKRIKIEL